jgi:hypothetical protein
MMTVENADHGRPTGRPRNQRERVLRALRSAGDHGITQVDFLVPGTVDGGRPIVRLPARIDELRGGGHHIEHAGRRNRCVVYILAAPPAQAAPAQELVDDDEQAALFSAADGAARPRSPYECREAA